MTQVLVTGGAGYIGSVLTRRLLQEGHQVVVYDRFLYDQQGVVQALGKCGDVTFINGDTRDIHKLVSCVRRADVVVHLAELVGDGLCDSRPYFFLGWG